MPIIYAQRAAQAQAARNSTRPDGETDNGAQPAKPTHAAQPSAPCDKPLPLAGIADVQRLLALLEAPDYCLRALREHGVSGADLLALREGELEDSRFRFPVHVRRKVLRLPAAWRAFVAATGSVTQTSISLEQCAAYYGRDRSPACLPQLQAAFHHVDTDGDGALSFEEFLLGLPLLEASLSEQQA